MQSQRRRRVQTSCSICAVQRLCRRCFLVNRDGFRGEHHQGACMRPAGLGFSPSLAMRCGAIIKTNVGCNVVCVARRWRDAPSVFFLLRVAHAACAVVGGPLWLGFRGDAWVERDPQHLSQAATPRCLILAGLFSRSACCIGASTSPRNARGYAGCPSLGAQ